MATPETVRPAALAPGLAERSPWRPRMLRWQVPAGLALAAVAVALLGPRPSLVGALYLAAVTPELTRIDLREHRLPDRLTLPGYPAALIGVGLGTLGGESALPALIGGAAFLALFLVLAVAGGMGFGDVKLAGVLGVVLGGAGLASAATGLLAAFLGGGLAAAVLLGRRGRGARLPFGPFLLLGFWIGLL
jgi:leader peptidase (prepilin peptidase)/N-methyltransferase